MFSLLTLAGFLCVAATHFLLSFSFFYYFHIHYTHLLLIQTHAGEWGRGPAPAGCLRSTFSLLSSRREETSSQRPSAGCQQGKRGGTNTVSSMPNVHREKSQDEGPKNCAPSLRNSAEGNNALHNRLTLVFRLQFRYDFG